MHNRPCPYMLHYDSGRHFLGNKPDSSPRKNCFFRLCQHYCNFHLLDRPAVISSNVNSLRVFIKSWQDPYCRSFELCRENHDCVACKQIMHKQACPFAQTDLCLLFAICLINAQVTHSRTGRLQSCIIHGNPYWSVAFRIASVTIRSSN